MPRKILSRRHALWVGLATVASIGAQASGSTKELNLEIQTPDNSEKNLAIEEASLSKRAAAKGLIYGASGRYRDLFSDPEYAERFPQECGILVPGLDLKWRTLRPSPNGFDFTAGDWMAKFARNHGMLFRGHTLVWHKALPLWFKQTVNHQNAEQLLVKYIEMVAGHYAGQIHSWDVVNEGIKTAEGRLDGLRKSPWLEFLGDNYIDLAFRVAAEADPQALLVYNETGLDYDTPEQGAKRDAVLKLLYRLKAIRTPIHALGIQAHLRGRKRADFNPTKLRDFLRHVGSLDLKIMITELDVGDLGLPKDINERDRLVAQHYYDYLTVVLDEPAVIGVLTWGLSDRYTWLSKKRPRSDGLPVRPLPLDRDLNRKPAWYAIAKAFDNAPNRTFFD